MQLCDYDGNPCSDVYAHMESVCTNYYAGASSLFTATTFENEPVLLNRQGEVLYQGSADDWILPLEGYDRMVVEQDGKALLCDYAGNVKDTASYDWLYFVYLRTADNQDVQRVPLLVGSYNYGNVTLYDVLDIEGNVLIEQAKNIDVLSMHRFWVEKGFYQGLMDETGAWLYRQSVFDSAVDE
jgi:hypothetical protein